MYGKKLPPEMEQLLRKTTEKGPVGRTEDRNIISESVVHVERVGKDEHGIHTYKIRKIKGPGLKEFLKPGDIVTDTDLDEIHQSGHRVREVKNKVEPITKVSEEAEPLDELSKATLGRYIQRATSDRAMSVQNVRADAERLDTLAKHGHEAGFVDKVADRVGDDLKLIKKRSKGIDMAFKKLTKEEVEQIDEISKGRVRAVAAKAGKEIDGLRKKIDSTAHVYQYHADKASKYPAHHPEHAFNAGQAAAAAAEHGSLSDQLARRKRLVDKTNRHVTPTVGGGSTYLKMGEEVEPINEISGEKLGRYIVKARKDIEAREKKGIEDRDELRKQTGLNVGTPFDDNLRKRINRNNGISKAMGKLQGFSMFKQHATEEVEPIVESGDSSALLRAAKKRIKENGGTDGLYSVADKISFTKEGHVKAYNGFFYRSGRSSEDNAAKVARNLQKEHGIEVEIVDHGEHHAPFRGGESVRRNSHFWSTLKIKSVSPKNPMNEETKPIEEITAYGKTQDTLDKARKSLLPSVRKRAEKVAHRLSRDEFARRRSLDPDDLWHAKDGYKYHMDSYEHPAGNYIEEKEKKKGRPSEEDAEKNFAALLAAAFDRSHRTGKAEVMFDDGGKRELTRGQIHKARTNYHGLRLPVHKLEYIKRISKSYDAFMQHHDKEFVPGPPKKPRGPSRPRKFTFEEAADVYAAAEKELPPGCIDRKVITHPKTGEKSTIHLWHDMSSQAAFSSGRHLVTVEHESGSQRRFAGPEARMRNLFAKLSTIGEDTEIPAGASPPNVQLTRSARKRKKTKYVNESDLSAGKNNHRGRMERDILKLMNKKHQELAAAVKPKIANGSMTTQQATDHVIKGVRDVANYHGRGDLFDVYAKGYK